MTHRLLIVDDDHNFIQLLREALCREPYTLLTASSASQALEILSAEPVDVVISDEVMPGMTGSEFLTLVRRRHPDTIRIMLTGHASLTAAIRAINEGEIYRFFTKPCNIFDLALTIRQALHHKELLEQNQRLVRMVKRQRAFIQGLEKSYPGITTVRRGGRGEILLEDEADSTAGEVFSEEIQDLLRECEACMIRG